MGDDGNENNQGKNEVHCGGGWIFDPKIFKFECGENCTFRVVKLGFLECWVYW
jgi:hypothetical protein